MTVMDRTLTLSQTQSPSPTFSPFKISSSRLLSASFWSNLCIHFSLSNLSPGRTRNVFLQLDTDTKQDPVGFLGTKMFCVLHSLDYRK